MKIKITGIDWDTDGEEVDLPTEVEAEIHEIYPDLEEDISNWLSDKFGYCHNGFSLEDGSAVDGNSLEDCGHHHISYYWRGDCEDTEYHTFKTKEDAWKFVKDSIEKSIKSFKKEEKEYGKTKIDFKKVKKHLFENGYTEMDDVVYCQCSSWWDNWQYWED